MSSPRQRNALIIAAALLGLMPAAPAWAFRCGNKLVLEGDAAEKVIARCGEPTERTREVALRPAVIWRNGRPIRVGSGPIEVVVETWVYDFGSHRLMQRLRLEDGVVKEIDSLGYGHP